MRALALFVLTAPLLAELSPRQRQIVEEPWAAVEPFLEIPAAPPPFGNAVEESALNPYVAAWFGDLLTQDAQRREVYQALFDLMEARVDKQVGSAPNNSGTTSLAMKGAAPAILGFAVENGGLQRQVSGTTATFRGNPYGLMNAFRGRGFLEMFESLDRATSSGAFQRFSNLFSFAVAFDTSRGATPGALAADRQQLASWSLRFQPVNRRDPRKKPYFREFARLSASEEAKVFRDSRDELDRAFAAWPALREWYRALQARIEERLDAPWRKKMLSTEAAKTEFQALLAEEFPKLTGLLRDDPVAVPAEVDRALDLYTRRLTTMLRWRAGIREMALKGELLSVDYTVTRDPRIPDLSHLTMVFETSLGEKRLQRCHPKRGAELLQFSAA
jgi:hypothetical protein